MYLDYRNVQNNSKPALLQVLHFWKLFSFRERSVFIGLCALAILSGSFFAYRFVTTKLIAVPAIGGSYTEGVLEEPHFINPLFASNEAEQGIVNLIFQGLFKIDHSGVFMPDAAESYSLSADGKQYTIVLKDNTWHDGKPLTADDVLFTIAMIQNPDYRSPLRANWQGVTAEKIDTKTLVLTLRQPYAPFLQNLTVGILPKHIWSTIRPENSFQSELNSKPVGSGPYKFKKLTRSSSGSILSYVIERNPDISRNEPPYIKTLTFQVFGSEESMRNAFQHGSIDGMSIVSAENREEVSTVFGKIYEAKLPQVFGVFFNQARNNILADKNVRTALNISIDRNDLVQSIFKGGGTALATPIPPGILGFDESIQIPQKDLTAAAKLLEKSGWIMSTSTGIRQKITPKTKTAPAKTETLHIKITTSVWPDLVEVAKYVQNEWKALGVDVSLEVLSLPELEGQSIRQRNYEALLFGEGFGHDPDPFAFWHSSQIKSPGLNLASYASQKVDALLESARRAKNPAEGEQKYKDFQKLVVADLPAIFLYAPNYFYAMRDTIQMVSTENLVKPSERFLNASEWYIKTRWKFR